ncbi:hypothetical protein HID58_023981 [Brassica napus]|uniref:Myb-like domain-containing protein n=1 Tax=Brassica napus TaxID=3708 RepID=A0ABQ8D5H0_BRANA|nr:hypothetical protein HID58_023981 [Brassica napus]
MYSPYYGFESLARKVTQLAGNLPLGLMVMGSYFRGMSRHEWEMELLSLNGEIESILKFSYDALCDEDKDLFIYISCFFNDVWIERVEEFLAENFSNLRYGLHRQFLVDRETCRILSNYTPCSINVIGIDCEYAEIEDGLYKNDKAFEKMSNLQFLRISDTHPRMHLPQNWDGFPFFFEQHWDGFPKTCLPPNLSPEFLVEIYMPSSNLEKLWEGSQLISHDCSSLKTFPKISTNIERLKIKGTAIEDIPSSIWSHLHHLAMLYSENLGKSRNAFGLIPVQCLCDKRIRELSPWIKEMSHLRLKKNMGLKRPFDAEEMQECNAKHARQLTYHPDQFDQSMPFHVPLDKTAVLGEDLNGLCEKKPAWSNAADHVEKDYDTCAPFSWVSTGLCQEDAQTQSSLSHESSGSDLTWRPLSPVEDVYTSLMNQPPRKLVPLGSNHQADIPECEIPVQANDDLERKLMGKCIIPMPDSYLCGAGQGRKECLCPDKDTVRCVRRHIMEARESLIEAIGYERFTELGLCEMGDEVISLWSEDEEDLFHKVVYSNPVSLGRDFWKQLKATFPSRTMKELVSYYFNVFILRRRATQNRLQTLDVDSDDDEWQVEYDVFCKGKSSSHVDNEEDEEEANSSDDDDDEEEEDSPANDAHCVYMDKVSREGGEVNVEDDSCMSFEVHDSNLVFPHSPVENRASHGSGLFSFDDACDGRLASSDCWTKNNDLLPTSNIMEEIFGKDEWGENGDNLKGK